MCRLLVALSVLALAGLVETHSGNCHFGPKCREKPHATRDSEASDIRIVNMASEQCWTRCAYESVAGFTSYNFE